MGDKEETRYKLTNATMAMLFLSAQKGELPNNTYGLAGKIAEMKDRNMNVGDFFLKRVAGGYWCDQLEQFLGASQIAGDAIGRNPSRLTESGIKFYEEIIREALPEYRIELEKVENCLKADFRFV